jgi:Zn-dependent protease with chaperone function
VSKGFAWRATTAVAMLLGAYLLMAALALGSLWAALLVLRHPGILTVPVLAASASVGVGVLHAAAAIWHRDVPPAGVRVERRQQPELWRAVDEVAAMVGVRGPDELWLDLAANAFVQEHRPLLGRPVRRLCLGLPLAVALSVDELLAVLAHEVGHYANKDVRLGPIVRTGTITVFRLAKNVGGRRFLGPVVLWYVAQYLKVAGEVSRDQEFTADQAAARVSSGPALARSLKALPWSTAAWDFYTRRFVSPAVQDGLFPADLLEGFAGLLATPERLAQRRAFLDAPPSNEHHPFDSHPTIAARLEQLPAGEAAVTDERPSIVLVDVPPLLPALAGPLKLTTVAASAGAGADRVVRFNAAHLLRATADGLPPGTPVGLAAVLDALAAGTFGVGQRLCGNGVDRAEAAQSVARCLTDLIHCALVDSGQAAWKPSFAGPAYQLVSPAYGVVDLHGVVTQALGDEQRVLDLRKRCQALGLSGAYGMADAA